MSHIGITVLLALRGTAFVLGISLTAVGAARGMRGRSAFLGPLCLLAAISAGMVASALQHPGTVRWMLVGASLLLSVAASVLLGLGLGRMRPQRYQLLIPAIFIVALAVAAAATEIGVAVTG